MADTVMRRHPAGAKTSDPNGRRAVRMIAAPPGAAGAGSGRAATLGVADWLSLAAAPTFVAMAVLTAVPGGGMPEGLCAPAQGASMLSGMTSMYGLMAAFHSAPWLKLISGWRNGAAGFQVFHPGR